MYTAFINEQAIDVGDISITMRLKNPMFDPDNGMEWSASYPFKLPNSPKNRALLGFPNRPNANYYPNTDYSFQHYINGVRLPGSLICVREISTDYIEAYVKIGRSDFLSTFKDKLLTHLSYDTTEYQTDHPNNPAYLFDILSQGYPDVDFALFPVRNPGFFDQTSYADKWKSPVYNPNGPYQNFILTYPNSTNYQIGFNCITPFPYLLSVIDKIFSESLFTLTENYLSQIPELAALCLYSANKCHALFSTQTVKIKVNEHLPSISIPEFFLALRAPFGVDMYFNYYTSECRILSRNDLIKKNDFVDFSKSVFTDHKVYIENSLLKFQFSMKGDSGDRYWQAQNPNISDFIKNASSYYVETFYYQLPTPSVHGNIGYVYSEDAFYIYTIDPETSSQAWTFLSQNHHDYMQDSGEDFKITGNIGSLLQAAHLYEGHFDDPWYWSTPATEKDGNLRLTPLIPGVNYADFIPRLMFYRGIEQNSLGNSYPLGSSFNYRSIGDAIEGAEYSIRWDGYNQPSMYREKGLYENFWENWFQWRSTARRVEFTKILTPLELAQIDFSKKHFAMNTLMFLDEVNFTIHNSGLSPAKITGWML